MLASTWSRATSGVPDEPAGESAGSGAPGTRATCKPITRIKARPRCPSHLATLAGRPVPVAIETPALVPARAHRPFR